MHLPSVSAKKKKALYFKGLFSYLKLGFYAPVAAIHRVTQKALAKPSSRESSRQTRLCAHRHHSGKQIWLWLSQIIAFDRQQDIDAFPADSFDNHSPSHRLGNDPHSARAGFRSANIDSHEAGGGNPCCHRARLFFVVRAAGHCFNASSSHIDCRADNRSANLNARSHDSNRRIGDRNHGASATKEGKQGQQKI